MCPALSFRTLSPHRETHLFSSPQKNYLLWPCPPIVFEAAIFPCQCVLLRLELLVLWVLMIIWSQVIYLDMITGDDIVNCGHIHMMWYSFLSVPILPPVDIGSYCCLNRATILVIIFSSWKLRFANRPVAITFFPLKETHSCQATNLFFCFIESGPEMIFHCNIEMILVEIESNYKSELMIRRMWTLW